MPYIINKKEKCVYKKNSDGTRGEKVGCTKGKIEDYIAALHMRANESKPVTENQYENEVPEIFLVIKPFDNCPPESMVSKLDPLSGLQDTDSTTIHGVYTDQNRASNIAKSLYNEFLDKANKLEEKKETTSKKIKSAINILEKKRKDLGDIIKENPKEVSTHRETIAGLTHKIDELMTKLERIEKSKKILEKQENKK